MRCTGEIIFLSSAVEIRQGKVITAFNDEATSFLCSKFYTTATGNTIVKFILNLEDLHGQRIAILCLVRKRGERGKEYLYKSFCECKF